MMAVLASALTPLCPAGRLPLKGGNRLLRRSRRSFSIGGWLKQSRERISPLEGEMAGRPEGGAAVRYPCRAEHRP